jgi:hypothetical protein
MVERDGKFNKTVAAIAAVGAALTAILTLWIMWDDWFSAKQSCSISGTVTDQLTGVPVSGVHLGWSPYANETIESPYRVNRNNFHTIAVSGSDGSFSGSCIGALDSVADDSFTLLYTQGAPRDLPCLRYMRTNQSFKNTGTHSGVNVIYRC